MDDYTKGVLAAAKTFTDAGMKNVETKFYPGDRHEILNEFDKEAVYDDLYHWLADKC